MRLTRLVKRCRNEEGAAVLEFALVLPILMILVFGIVDFARAFYAISTLVSAVREGARYAAVLEQPLASTSQQQIRDRVRATARPFGGDPVLDAQIYVQFDGRQVTVGIQDYPFQLLNPIARPINGGTLEMSRRAVFRWERSP